MHTLKNFFLLTFFVSTIACKHDSNQANNASLSLSKLQGQWELTSALRNGRPTETLTGTFYFFEADQVTTNLTPDGQQRTFHFESEGNQLKLKEQSEFMTFDIDSISDSLLQMRTEIQGYKFVLAFKKVEQDTTESQNPDTITLQ